MVKIPKEIREKLKKPLGALHKDFVALKRYNQTHRIITIGDICTLSIIAMGIYPHLAVFDYKYMRRRLEPDKVNILKNYFKKQKRYKNPPGILSEKILADAKQLIEEGGAILIEGEEDLTALAFILGASERDVVIYGQPKEGLVIVEYNQKLKKKIEKWLASSTLSL